MASRRHCSLTEGNEFRERSAHVSPNGAPPARTLLGASEGFTLVEIIIVAAIVALIVGGVIFSLSRARRTTDLDYAATGAVSFLRLAHERTIAADDNTTWGVHVDPAMLSLFSGAVYSGVADDTFAFPEGITASVSLAGGGNDIVFDRLEGTTATNGTLTLAAQSGDTRTIAIYASGDISMTGAPPAQLGTRVTDTRHAHLLLPFSLNGKTTMRLTFHDPPNADVVENIDIPSNTQNGQLLWEGDVNVNGASQHLRIVSHSIGVTDTNLAVRRDRTENNRAVDLDVDGTLIATYDAAGTLTPGVGVTADIQ